MSTTDLAQQVADLTTATTQLTQEVVGQKARLTAAADTATSKASDASGSASAASASATSANAAAAAAETSKNQAAEISGLDTVEEAIDLTLAKTLGLMTETEAMAQADAYEQMFAASGMVHMGKHRDKGNQYGMPVNEGIWAYPSPNGENSLMLGGIVSEDNVTGFSKTDHPVTYIAGAVTNILHRSSSNISQATSVFELPPAEAGTRIYDSTGNARGSGKATLDFRYDVDPKYGDVPTGTEAEIRNEAVARAFEGAIKNGDFRNGDASWSKTNGASMTVIGGVARVEDSGVDDQYVYQSFSSGISEGKCIEVQFVLTAIDSTPCECYIEMAYGGTAPHEIYTTSELGSHKVIFDVPANTNNVVQIRIRVTDGAWVELSSLYAKPVTEEVVTHPVDLLTWESYDEELTGRTEVFECIQSLSTTFGTTDVPTVLSTRPNSYFDQYDGQSDDPDAQNTKYRCVVWDDLTDEQKRKVAAYMGNKLYIGENGYLVNRRLRARTFRGTGNGDWRTTDSTSKLDLAYHNSNPVQRVLAQGAQDAIEYSLGGTSQYFRGTQYHAPQNVQDKLRKGSFTLGANSGNSIPSSICYKGRCYMYVVASVPRANQGAYVKGLNEFGCGRLRNAAGDTDNGWPWHSATAYKPKTEAECFTEVTKNNGRGDIAGNLSGHPDGIFHDGITAGGLNGVIDWRLPAFEGDSPEEAAKVQAKVENGSYRGLEKLVWTKVLKSEASDFKNPTGTIYRTSSTASSCFIFFASSVVKKLNETLNTGDVVRIHDTENGVYITGKISGFDITGSSLNLAGLRGYNGYVPEISNYASISDLSLLSILCESELNLSVSGEFNTSMVIGDPANILQTDALKDGWLGTWCPAIPDGTPKDFPYTRKKIGEAVSKGYAVYTSNNGASWSSAVFTSSGDNVKNTFATSTMGGEYILCVPYTAYAKVTKPSENKPVYNGKKGLMDVLVGAGAHWTVWASLLQESLIGKVATSSASGSGHKNASVNSFSITPETSVVDMRATYPVTYAQVSNPEPNNNSRAVKALPYQISDNGQCSLGVQANELTWDDTAGNWGDDSTIKITASGSDTFVDLNGNTNLSVVHELAIPHGWTKNRARAGEQVEGVDL